MTKHSLGLALILSLLPCTAVLAAADEHAGQVMVPVAQRSINVTMSDNMRFSPEQIQVKQGETIRFVLTNKGQLPHEFVLGSVAKLKEHADMMASMPGMHHEDAAVQNVEPGSTAELIWTFNQVGKVHFACLVVGHYEAGMVGTIDVTP